MPSGRYSNFGSSCHAPAVAATVTATVISNANILLRTTTAVKPLMAAAKRRAAESMNGKCNRRRPGAPGPGTAPDKPPPPNNRFDSAGITVIDTTSDNSTDTEIATAMSRNNCPASSSMMSIGMNTMTVVNAETSTAPHTCFAPLSAAWKLECPASLWR